MQEDFYKFRPKEQPKLIKQEDTVIPMFDTLRIHAEAAVEEDLKQ